ncbi:MAG: terminase, partial [Oxalobacter sp.]|nr:terminase [Oxalobacter sp.]
RRYEAPGGHEGDLNPNIANRNAGGKRNEKNHFTDEQKEMLKKAFLDALFQFQHNWFENRFHRTREILKSRQIGATWYFAREALVDAVETGSNEIFLSASKSQAHVFRQYIVQFAMEACGVELKGDPIVLSNGAHLYFLGTNARTAQGYHGNFYFDEFFWTFKFEELNKVASGMALHKRWRKTYFSTPSSMSHEAYPFWTGDSFNRRRKKEDRVQIDVSHKSLAEGRLCEDRVWRQIVTIEDAEKGGCDLFDIDELRNYEYSPDQFDNLLMCNFIDDTASIFPLSVMQRCMVDSWDAWNDYKPYTARPFGNRGVWIGFDPSRSGDSAGCVVMAPPLTFPGKFRVLEKHQWRGMDFEAMGQAIEKMTQQYNVEYIGIDATGMGLGVYEVVRKFYPGAKKILYSPESKGRMVLKAQNVINNGRLEFDAGSLDIVQSFMAIRKNMTASGQHVTYVAGRSEATGHADLAWAVMHVLDNEPLAGNTENRQSFMEIYR